MTIDLDKASKVKLIDLAQRGHWKKVMYLDDTDISGMHVVMFHNGGYAFGYTQFHRIVRWFRTKPLKGKDKRPYLKIDDAVYFIDQFQEVSTDYVNLQIYQQIRGRA